MSKSIIISESQYNRLLLIEQVASDNQYFDNVDDWSSDSKKQDIFDRFVTNSAKGNAFREWVHSEPTYLNHVNKWLDKNKKWGDVFDKRGPYNNMFIKEVFKNVQIRDGGVLYPMGIYWLKSITPPANTSNPKEEEGDPGDNEYVTGRKKHFKQGLINLEATQIPKKYWPSWDQVAKSKYIQTACFNLAGYAMVKEIEWFKENYWGGSQGCRWIDIKGIGSDYKGSNPIVLTDLNPDGDLGKKMSNRSWLPKSGSYISESPKNMKTNFPWMTYWLLADFRSSGGMAIEKRLNTTTPYSKILGDTNWINWMLEVYGTRDIKKIKGMITNAQVDNYAIGNFMYSNGKRGCFTERDATAVEAWLSETDYHFWLDVASIVVLAIPVAGVFLSAGIDLVNATSYAIEGDNLSAGLTGIGALPLFGKFFKLVKPGTYKKVTKYIDELAKLSSEAKNPTLDAYAAKEIEKIAQKKYKEIGLDKLSDVEKGHVDDFFKAIKENEDVVKQLGKNQKQLVKIGEEIIKKDYNKLEKLFKNTKNKFNYQKYLELTKHKKFQTIMGEVDGDILKAISKFGKMKAGREFLIQMGLFAGLYVALPPAMIYTAEKGLIGFDNKIATKGYGDWEKVKEVFGSDGSKYDNIKLQKAWDLGWRPYDKEGNFDPFGIDFATKKRFEMPEKLQTQTYKSRMKDEVDYEEWSQQQNDNEPVHTAIMF